MPERNPEVVRQPIALRGSKHRHLDERLVMRFPALLRFIAATMWKRPPSSSLRRALLRRVVVGCFDAFNRRDYESAFALYDADVETIFPASLASVGFPAETHGRDERVEAQRQWNESWGDFRNEPQELIDLGDRVLILGRLVGSGLSSGVGFDTEVAYLFDVQSGRAVHEEMFTDQGAALEAAGLRGEPGSGA